MIINHIINSIKSAKDKAQKKRLLNAYYEAIIRNNLKMQEWLIVIMDTIDTAMSHAPDVTASSKLSHLKARAEACVSRLNQQMDAAQERDFDRVEALDKVVVNAVNQLDEEVNALFEKYGNKEE